MAISYFCINVRTKKPHLRCVFLFRFCGLKDWLDPTMTSLQKWNWLSKDQLHPSSSPPSALTFELPSRPNLPPVESYTCRHFHKKKFFTWRPSLYRKDSSTDNYYYYKFWKRPSFVLLFPNVLILSFFFEMSFFLPQMSFFCPSFGHPVLLFFCRICSHLTSHFAKNCLRRYKLTIFSKSSSKLSFTNFVDFLLQCRKWKWSQINSNSVNNHT